jgi:hypothetical protein
MVWNMVVILSLLLQCGSKRHDSKSVFADLNTSYLVM